MTLSASRRFAYIFWRFLRGHGHPNFGRRIGCVVRKMASSSSRYGAVPSDEAASAVSAIDDHTPEPSASRRRGPRVVLAAVASLMVCAVVVSRMASSSGGGGGGGGGGLAAGASSLARSERAVAGGAQTLVQKYKLQSTTMPLIGHLALTLSSDYWVQVSWHTTDGTSTVLWSEWKLAGNDTTDELSVQFYLPRLRSSTQYLVHVWAAPDRNNGTTAQKVAEYTYTNPSTGERPPARAGTALRRSAEQFACMARRGPLVTPMCVSTVLSARLCNNDRREYHVHHPTLRYLRVRQRPVDERLRNADVGGAKRFRVRGKLRAPLHERERARPACRS